MHLSRRPHMLEAFRRELRFSLRNVKKTPAFAAAVVVTLALGIGGNAAILDVVDSLLFRVPKAISSPSRVFKVVLTGSDQTINSFPGYQDLSRNLSLLVMAARVPAQNINFGRGQDSKDIKVECVTASYFSVLQVRPLLGRYFSSLEEKSQNTLPAVIISYAFWHQEFAGDPNVLGRETSIGGQSFAIIGVAPEGFTGSDYRSLDAWLPISQSALLFGDDLLSNRGARFLDILARPKANTTPEAAAAEATSVYRHNGGAPNIQVRLRPYFRGVRNRLSDDAILSLWISGTAFLVFMIACANVGCLFMSEMLRRRHEMAVRSYIGATTYQLICTVLIQYAILCTIGGIFALFVTAWVRPAVNSLLLPLGFYEPRILTLRTVGTVTAFIAVAFISTGIIPAWVGSHFDLNLSLASGGRSHTRRGLSGRRTVIVLQTVLAIVSNVGAGLFVRSFRNASAIDLGFDSDRVALARIELNRPFTHLNDVDTIYTQLSDRIESLPGVEAVALSDTIPFATAHIVGARALPSNVAQSAPATLSAVSANYFSVLGIPLSEGRYFTNSDRIGVDPVVVVNQSLVEALWATDNAIGKCLWIANMKQCLTVVGVVRDSKQVSRFDGPHIPKSQVYVLLEQAGVRAISSHPSTLLIRTRLQVPNPLRNIFEAAAVVVPDSRYLSVQSMSEIISPEIRRWRVGTVVFALFSGLAQALIAIGMYSTLSLLIKERTVEIGIRLAIGASRRDVRYMIYEEGMKWIALGIVIGTVCAVWTANVMKGLLYGVRPVDAMTFVSAIVLLVTIAVVSCWVPARRAARIDPIMALRYE